MIGFVPGDGPLHRAHPLTVGSVVLLLAALAFTLPGAWPVVAVGAAVVLVFVERVAAVLKPAAVLCIPLFFFLAIIHGLQANDWVRALALGARIATTVVVFLLFLASVHSGRLVEALVEKRVPFAVVFLLSATLQAVPAMRDRAVAVLEAQRCRGLRAGGGPFNRLRALLPLTIPLVMSSLAMLDDRTVALETRGAGAGRTKTPLADLPDCPRDRVLRWAILLTIPVLVWLRVTRW